MKLIAISVIALAAISPAFATKKSSQEARQSAIENSILNRISIQNDFWFNDGDFPRVIQLHRFTYEYVPADYEIATNLGWMLGNIQEYGEELSIYSKFRKDNYPKDPDASFPEANFYYFRKAYAKVPTILEDSITRNPHPNSFRILAHAYDRMGMMKDCVRVWTAFVREFPEDLKGKENLKRATDKLAKAGK